MHLSAPVGHEQVGEPVVVEVAVRDAHPRVRVRHAGLGRELLEAEADPCGIGFRAPRPGNVVVEAVGFRVVRDIEVEVAVAIEVGEQGAQAVLEADDLQSGLGAHLLERHTAPVGGTLIHEQEIANAEVRVRETEARPLDGVVEVRVAGHEQIREGVPVHVPDRGRRVPPEGLDPRGRRPLRERAVAALVPEQGSLVGRRHVQIGVPVRIEVGRDAPVAAHREVGAGGGAHVDEGALLVVEERVAREPALLIPAACLRQGVGVHRVQVEPAIAVVVEPADASAEHRARIG